MSYKTDLNILFATSFSDACFRSVRALAQFGDLCRLGVTIAHVAKPGADTLAAQRELHSFLGEADDYDGCRRLLLESHDPVKAISGLCEQNRFDLIFAPASDRLGVHGLFKKSLRASLLKHCSAPVWTAGRCLDRGNFKTSIKTVACLMDFDAANHSYLRLCMSLARQMEAETRLVHVIPPIDEGTLARSITSNAPLAPDVVREKLRNAFGHACPKIDVAVGEMSRELPRLLNRCEADLLFVGPGQALRGSWRPRIASYLDRVRCPVICVDGASTHFSGWSFETTGLFSDLNSVVPLRDHSLVS